MMISDDLGDQHWEAARFAITGAFWRWPDSVRRPDEIRRFLDHHVRLQGAGEDHRSHLGYASQAILFLQDEGRFSPLTSEYVRDFDWTNPSFVRGIRSMMHPSSSLQWAAIGLTALASDTWFDCPVPMMEPEQMHEFCENLVTFLVNDQAYHDPFTKWIVTVLFGMLYSQEWRKHTATRLWSILAYCPRVGESELVRWCLRNAVELLEFVRGLTDKEGLKWWCWTLWFHYDKLGTAARDEVKVTVGMLRNDGLPDLNLYLKLLQDKVSKMRQQIDELSDTERLSSAGRIIDRSGRELRRPVGSHYWRAVDRCSMRGCNSPTHCDVSRAFSLSLRFFVILPRLLVFFSIQPTYYGI